MYCASLLVPALVACRLELFGEPLLICRGLSSIAFPEAPETGA
jgi:hypothetical protein